jgi:hypothetical protein
VGRGCDGAKVRRCGVLAGVVIAFVSLFGEAGLPALLLAQDLAPQQHGRLFPPQDLGLLEGPDRDAWQKPEQIMDRLAIADGSAVADIGAGAGWFTIRLARRIASSIWRWTSGA